DLQVDRFVVDLGLVQRHQVVAVEVAVPLDARVDHPAVQARADLNGARPVFGGELRGQACQVFILAADEPALDEAGPPTPGVCPGQLTGERSVPHVQL